VRLRTVRPGQRQGDPEFAGFVEERWARHLRLAVLLTGDRHRAEELLQDCLVRLYVRWRRMADPDAADRYLYRMLVNSNINAWRRRTRELLVADAPEREVRAAAPAGEYDDLHRALAVLPRGQRAVLVLRYFLDLSEAETARVLGCTIGTVKSQNHRALQRLSDALRHSEYEKGGMQR
jgi:RNA polymerase sigma-70 factor (sigma-E family)